ncbi:MAG: Patatin-like [Prolixibacteraceae bacterium]|nr:MAG: Patatin-like [Prolixibacteraceae bacterium]
MNRKIALVLSGGGARGIAHIGVIEELEKRGYVITSIAGTSMGALIGGMYAAGKLGEYKQWMCSLDKLKVFSLVDFTFSADGIVKGDKVLKAIKEFVPDTNIETLKVDYSATAADIENHKEIVYRSGSLYEAIRASIAIPMVITPVIKDNAIIVDGGVVNNLPIRNVTRNRGDLLVAVYVNANVQPIKLKISKKEEKEKKSVYLKKLNEFYEHLNIISPKPKKEKIGYFNLIDKTIVSASLQLVQLAIEKNPPDILVNISRDTCGTYDFYRAEELVEIGRQSAIKTLDEFERKN